jgi:hypothetical protein
MIGMTELYTFVKLLEEDWSAVMRGTAIEYGSTASKKVVNVSESMGWDKKQKRQSISKNEPLRNNQESRQHKADNDGWAPDTTALLVPEEKKKKLGRPKNPKNVDRNPFTTYPSYAASNDPRRTNCCWLAAALESLYALFGPLWLVGTKGSGTNLFTLVVHHFTSRTTHELTHAGQIRSILTKGQSKIFDHAHNKYPGLFEYGCESSFDYFLEVVLNPKTNPPNCLKTFFTLEEFCKYQCTTHGSKPSK